jgi:hypothetical protein
MSRQLKHDSLTETVLDRPEPVHEHAVAIDDLAEAFDLPVPLVADMYWSELARLREGATIDLYLPVLTARRVRDRLRRMPRPDDARYRSVLHVAA